MRNGAKGPPYDRHKSDSTDFYEEHQVANEDSRPDDGENANRIS